MFDLEEHSIPQFEKIEPWLNLKIKEFQLLGYQQISQADLWHYLISFCWKKSVPAHYYQQIQEIMSLTPNDYLDFASIEALISPAVSLEEMEIFDLF